MKALITRGIPGAGKTSYVEQLPGSKIVCSADIAHITNGVYRFDPTKKEKAHADCFNLWMKILVSYRYDSHSTPDWLICDNTNLTAWEVARYWETAKWVGIEPQIIRIEVEPFKAIARNQHSVPVSRVLDMYTTLRSERLPPHFKETVILADSFSLREQP